MKLAIPILSAIETAINAWLKLDAEALEKCTALAGKIIRLHITGLDLNLYFLPATSGIQVMENYPDNQQGGEVDVTIHGSPMALVRLSTAKNSSETLLKSDIEIDGEIHLAEKFSMILGEVDIDWEELLSKLVGDIIAYQAGQIITSASGWFKESAEAMRMNTVEYLSEETKLTPADAEISHYIHQVDDLRMAIDRLEARITLLQESSSSKVPNNKKPEA